MSDTAQLEGAKPAPVRPQYRQLGAGDKLPSMVAACGDRPTFAFDGMAGRYLLFGFFLSLEHADNRALVERVAARRDLFNDAHASFIGVTMAPRDRTTLANQEPGVRYAWDFDHAMSRACGALPIESDVKGPNSARRAWILADPSLHVLRTFPMTAEGTEDVLRFVEGLPPPDQFGGVSRPAPILMLPNVLEPELCRKLIDLYEADGGTESGIHRDGEGVLDHSFKRRRDYFIEDPQVLRTLKHKIARRVLPEIEKLFFMQISHIERHIVGCYSAADAGHFSPHTDNGPGLTAHRRFAVSINLSDGFDGGEVVFPEYNQAGYKAPAGWAVIFPCAILHAVRRVTGGVRYAYLPFVYDEAGRAIRDAELVKAGITP